MKKNNISLLGLGMMVMSLTILSALIGCKFNLSDNKYLPRPDIRVLDNEIEIRGTYVNSNTEYINIYRQDVTESEKAEIERIAILFPAGFNKADQTYVYDDVNIFRNRKYRYYVRFVENDGSKNRTEWSEAKQNTSDALPTTGSFAYTIPSGADYTYIKSDMKFELPDGKTFTAPNAIADFAKYKPALVFECGESVQAIELKGDPTDPDTLKNVNLKELIPQDFFYKDIKLVGIIGQKLVKGKITEDAEEESLQYITWTPLASIKLKNETGVEISTFKLEPEHGDAGYDYSIASDNEN